MKIKFKDRFSRTGVAIVTVLTFAVMAAIFLFALLKSITNVKRQNVTAITMVQAHYMAQSALQHLRTKFQYMPRHMVYASIRHNERDVTPFTTSRNLSRNIPSPLVRSNRRNITNFERHYNPDYTLFSNTGGAAVGRNESPVNGSYELLELKFESEQGTYRQNAFQVKVTGTARDHTGIIITVEMEEHIMLSVGG